MSWIQKTIDGVQTLVWDFEGSTASAWETKVWLMLNQACAAQAARNEMAYGFGEPFVNADHVTLVNGEVSDGHCHNTVTPGGGIIGENIVPLASAATTGIWTFSASSMYSTTYDGYKAFAGDTDGSVRWQSSDGGALGWLQAVASADQTLTGYAITQRGYGLTYFTNVSWVFEGSATGADGSWTALDTRNNQSFSEGVRKVFALANPATYRYFRIRITSNPTSISIINKLELLGTNVNAIPTMTAATTGDVVMSASSELSAEYAAWKSGDKLTGTQWLASGVTACWLKAAFSESCACDGYSILWSLANASGSAYPTTWTYEGSATGVDGSWSVLDTQNSQTFTANVKRFFKLSSTANYKYYRINISASAGGGGVYTGIVEFGVMTPQSNPIPVMTGYTTGDWTASASSYYDSNLDGSYPAWGAFDGVVNTSYGPWASGQTLPATPVWIRIANTTAPFRPVRVKIAPSTVASAPKDYIIQGSTNGTTWTDLKTVTNDTTWTAGVLKTINLDVVQNCNYLRLYITSVQSAAFAWITEIQPICEAIAGSVNVVTITPDAKTISNPTKARIIFTGYNADASAILDVGNSGSNKVEVYPVVDGVQGSAPSFTSESLGDNQWRFTSADISLASTVTTLTARVQTFARGSDPAPNIRIYEMVVVYC